VVPAIADVATDSLDGELLTVDLTSAKLRDEHRGTALHLGDLHELQQETSLDGIG